MARYNPFRWWTKGRGKKPCSPGTPLIIKIQNGDFDYCYMFNEIKDVYEENRKTYQLAYDKANLKREEDRIEHALESSRMKRIKIRKLEEQAILTEEKILNALRYELHNTFKEDIWDLALDKCPGEGTAEDIYWFYHNYIIDKYGKKG
jgi:hypothetical protein